MSDPKHKRLKAAVFILEDSRHYLDSLCSFLSAELPDCYVSGEPSVDAAKAQLQRMDAHGFSVQVIIVDQVLHRDRDAGIRFLRWAKSRYPEAQRVLLSGQTTRDEIQQVLDEGLVHHFQSKSAVPYEDFPNVFAARIRSMVSERTGGNVVNPDLHPDRAFRDFLSKWMSTLPNGAETMINSLCGEPLRAGALLDDPDFVSRFRDSYVTAKLDELVMGSSPRSDARRLLTKVESISPGAAGALPYQRTVSQLLAILFEPNLTAPHAEKRNASGTSRYDLVFLNKAPSGFWHDLKLSRGNAVVIFDTKNTKRLKPEDCDQMLRYSSNWRGNVVFIVCRNARQPAFDRRAGELLKEKDVCVLVLDDHDLERMLDAQERGGEPTDVLGEKLRDRIERA